MAIEKRKVRKELYQIAGGDGKDENRERVEADGVDGEQERTEDVFSSLGLQYDLLGMVVVCGREIEALLVRTSKRNTNITCFPFAMGQRGGRSVIALWTSDVWKVGSKSTQMTFPRLSF